MADRSMWVRALRPVDDAALSRSVLAGDRLAEMIELFGPGPVGWSVELAEDMPEGLQIQCAVGQREIRLVRTKQRGSDV